LQTFPTAFLATPWAVKISGEDEGLANAARTADWPLGPQESGSLFPGEHTPKKHTKKKHLQKNSGNWVMATQIFYMFIPKIGEDVQFDEHIFQMGWFNHQPV